MYSIALGFSSPHLVVLPCTTLNDADVLHGLEKAANLRCGLITSCHHVTEARLNLTADPPVMTMGANLRKLVHYKSTFLHLQCVLLQYDIESPVLSYYPVLFPPLPVWIQKGFCS